MNRLLCMSIICFLFKNVAFGDNGFMGSIGGNVYLSKSSTIQMVREYILLTLNKNDYTAKCVFTFFNNGNDTVVTVGFPNYHYNVTEETMPIKVFKAKQDGKELNVKTNKEVGYYSLDTNANRVINIVSEDDIRFKKNDTNFAWFCNSWYTWQSRFKKKDTTIIIDEYTGNWGGNNTGAKEVEYILGTGGSWKGPIGEGRIVFDHSQIATSAFAYYRIEGKPIDYMDYDDSTVFSFANLLPSGNEAITFSLFCYWSDPFRDGGLGSLLHEYKHPFYEGCLKINRNATSQDMINEIYARHGYIFKTDSIQKSFEKHGWYKPDPQFSISKLNKYELEAIQIIKDYKP